MRISDWSSDVCSSDLHADAQGCKTEPATGPLELMHEGHGKACARHAERVAERDGAAVGVDMGGVIGKPERAQHGERLAGEGIIQPDRVKVRDGQAEPRQELSSRGDWATAQAPRLAAAAGQAADAG